MYAYIKGIIEDIETDKVIIECNGIGYNVFVPATVTAGLGYIGKEIKLYTYLNVKEDTFNLFGFLSKEDLKLFKMLISVNGIGPKGALGILGTFTADDLRFAIMSGDSKSIATAPGIGKKTAEKVILELRDKLKLSDTFFGNDEEDILTDAVTGNNDIISEAAMALTALGYGQGEALKAVRSCDISAEDTVESVIKQALKIIQ